MVLFVKRIDGSLINRNKVRKIIFILFIKVLLVLVLLATKYHSRSSSSDHHAHDIYKSSMDFENFDYMSGAPLGVYIVPNVVHFIRFGEKNMTFIEAVCILAALKNQRPDKLVIHADHVEQTGKYWEVVREHPLSQGVLEVRFRPQPSSIFGKELSRQWRPYHAGDVARLEVLMEEGGIFLDGDSYIVKSLDGFRKFEMTLGWQEGGGISNQVIIAHRNARFLYEWYDSYREYNKSSWFYNAGDKPTEILVKKPHLIHRVRRYLAEYKNWFEVYLTRSNRWREHYAIHLMIGWQFLLGRNLSDKAVYPVVFNEVNILNYKVNIKDMALDVYPFPTRSTDTIS